MAADYDITDFPLNFNFGLCGQLYIQRHFASLLEKCTQTPNIRSTEPTPYIRMVTLHHIINVIVSVRTSDPGASIAYCGEFGALITKVFNIPNFTVSQIVAMGSDRVSSYDVCVFSHLTLADTRAL
jgi:predicted metal-dependent peptidase